ncbi:hypothetical protein N9B94_03855 [Verrucomicrobia bacterium]|nr:hypothetical protein [Verrucomicrobiota bacterium]
MNRISEIIKRALLIPNILNLDAPIVATVWMYQFALLTKSQLTHRHYWLLFLAVWLIYFADRWLDQSKRHFKETARHVTHGGLGNFAIAAGAFVTVLLFQNAFTGLNPKAWLGGLVLVGLTLGYLGCVHFLGEAFPKPLPKELWVGVVFSAGCALVPWSLAESATITLFLMASGFGWLCFLNCAAITRWENLLSDQSRTSSLLNTWPCFLNHFGKVSFVTAAVFFTIGLATQNNFQDAFLAMGLSAALLGAIERRHRLIDSQTLRIAADVVLLTPLLFVFFD